MEPEDMGVFESSPLPRYMSSWVGPQTQFLEFCDEADELFPTLIMRTDQNHSHETEFGANSRQ